MDANVRNSQWPCLILTNFFRASFNTVTATPSCTVPPRPQQHDPVASAIPTILSVPFEIVDGVAKDVSSVVGNVVSSVGSLLGSIFKREDEADIGSKRAIQRRERLRLRDASRAQVDKRNNKKRSADPQTVTSTETTSTATSTVSIKHVRFLKN